MLHRRATIGCGGIFVNDLVDPLGLANGPSAVGSKADVVRNCRVWFVSTVVRCGRAEASNARDCGTRGGIESLLARGRLR
jgi:hypothetical protein